MGYLDEIYRERAEKAGIVYVDIWDGFVDDSGRYAVQGPDFEGQIRRLRTGDGVHFTKAGAVKLANYVDAAIAPRDVEPRYAGGVARSPGYRAGETGRPAAAACRARSCR